MRVLAVTKIFPNSLEPLSSPFNRQQFRELAKLCDLRVLATIPWFPGASVFRKWSAAGRLTAVPRAESIDGLEVTHPRFLFVPKVGHGISGPLYAASLLKDVLPLRGSVDVVLGSFAYPDGYAAIVLGNLLGVPSVVKLHGSDINVIAHLPGPERRLRAQLPNAERVVAVSRALAEKVEALGVPRDRIVVVPNGVDTALFRPRDRQAARRELGLDASRRVVLYVGRLEVAKGVRDLLEAFQLLMTSRPDVDLVLLGDGSLREACRAAESASDGRVRCLGGRPLHEVPSWLAACDVTTLPSWNEGMPNVVLEALASGRRVVGTNVGGIPDLLGSPLLGTTVPARDPRALAAALGAAVDLPYDPEQVRRESNSSSWQDSAAKLHEVLRSAVESNARKAA